MVKIPNLFDCNGTDAVRPYLLTFTSLKLSGSIGVFKLLLFYRVMPILSETPGAKLLLHSVYSERYLGFL